MQRYRIAVRAAGYHTKTDHYLPVVFFAAILFVTLINSSYSIAQDLEPRLYTNTPVGMNFIILGYGYSDGNVLTDPSLPVENGSVEVHGPVLGFARSLNFAGTSGKVDGILSFVCASGSAEFMGQPMERDICGLVDPRFRISVNLYGAPALTLKDYVNYKQDLIIGTSVQIGVPIGQYDSEKLLNIGTNRWSVKPEIGMSKAIGPFILELASAVTFYTNNNNFFNGKKKEQDPLYSFQGHIVYGFKSGIWFAMDGTYYLGAKTIVDGVKNDDKQESSRFGLTIAMPVNKKNSVKLFGSTGVTARTGGDFDTVGIAWQYRWGGGL